jgi:DNA-damage-inducible protein D
MENIWQDSLSSLEEKSENNMEANLTVPDNTPTFEDFKKENGIAFWWATDLMRMLGYESMTSFEKAIQRATKACMNLEIPHYANFMAEVRIDDKGNTFQDFKLTRFACYLTAMNADTKKKQVAEAQLYFVEQTRRMEMLIENHEEFERILSREEIKEGNKSLSSIAHHAGVEDYAKFQNAGYMGMYNMINVELARKRKIEAKELYEYMGRAELAANLFRITQTEERIKNFGIKGQANLEQTHFKVGQEVRKIVKENTGKNPENLPKENKIKEVQKELKKGYKKMLDQDCKIKKKK